MKIEPHIHEWNFQSVAVMQAMLGMLSPNFRRVCLDHDGSQWITPFFLEHEDAEDQEEIEDFVGAWYALQMLGEAGDFALS